MKLHEQMEQWRSDGTFDRFHAARRDRTSIRVKRSSGEFVDGVIVEVNVRCIVAFGEGAKNYGDLGLYYRMPPGVCHKTPLMEDLIEWNPWLGAPDGSDPKEDA